MGHTGKAHLGLAGEEGLRCRGHADNVHTQLPECQTFSACTEARPFNRDEIASLVNRCAGLLHCPQTDVAQVVAKGVGDAHVNHQPASAHIRVIEKAESPQSCAVENLVRYDDIAGTKPLLQASTGADCDQILDAQHLEAIDIGALV